MAFSVFDMFRVGVGPSSSHTVGPMRAAAAFVAELQKGGRLERAARVCCELMGSLGATGRGHATDSAVMLGLMGENPASVDTAGVPALLSEVAAVKRLMLAGLKSIEFDYERDIVFLPETVARFHTNALQFTAFDESGVVIHSRRYYSVGGGFIVVASASDPETIETPGGVVRERETELPYPYGNAAELVAHAKASGLGIAGVVRANERVMRDDAEIDRGLDRIWAVMQECIERGLSTEGVMPGPFSVPRRAAKLAERLKGRTLFDDPLMVLDWVNVWAFAVSEENACGGRVVTSPTNGAAGVIPAVLKYYTTFIAGADQEGVQRFLLTAAAIGLLYKRNASISGAEVGCQGEVGVACSMAAGALADVLGATVDQIENAAEIGMEHHLGLTCDPVAGQVQIPCIERNAVAAVKALNASRLALSGSGRHVVSLDTVMQTMFETGRDMKSKYRETSRGGLAVNLVEC